MRPWRSRIRIGLSGVASGLVRPVRIVGRFIDQKEEVFVGRQRLVDALNQLVVTLRLERPGARAS